MAEAKTKKTSQSAREFVAAIPDPAVRADCETIYELMYNATKEEGVMYGASIVGFAEYEYRYASGRSGVWPKIGFSPRKQSLSIYLTAGFENKSELLAQLGKHSIGKSCLYVKRLSEIDIAVLKKMIVASLKEYDE